MPSRAQSGIATVLDWNTSTNVYKTGDSANIEIFFIKDGVVTTPTNQAAITESSSSAGGPIGAYSIAWTSAEGTCNTLWIGGTSSSANCVIIPVTITFENLPIFPSVVTSTSGATSPLGVNVVNWAGVAVNALISGRVDSIANQVGTNAIGAGARVAGSLLTTAFQTAYLTSALVDITAENAIADALLDRANAVETGITPRNLFRATGAALAGNLSGAGTTAVGIWGINTSTTRLSAATDQSGNRSSFTYNL